MYKTVYVNRRNHTSIGVKNISSNLPSSDWVRQEKNNDIIIKSHNKVTNFYGRSKMRTLTVVLYFFLMYNEIFSMTYIKEVMKEGTFSVKTSETTFILSVGLFIILFCSGFFFIFHRKF